jgi:alcohol dehydrogenase class IV
VILPYVLSYNRIAIEERIERAARWLGLKPKFSAFLDWVLDFREALGIPGRLADIGIAAGDSERIAAMAAVDPCAAGNPRPFDASVARRVFDAAVIGTL